ncbi:unnamed protein product [Ceratitis capitata]|uniref:(Mediterranean fruit fly) hypothetical protein n=1 Tax=Ceratitis capitata TaxID=7213 RepID=A0A811U2R2_CERCA|nr:unnamed protein product [Ceratitis capitata]
MTMDLGGISRRIKHEEKYAILLKMAPTRNTRAVSKQAVTTTIDPLPMSRKGLTRRSAVNVQDQNVDIQTRGKRKAEQSPAKNDKIKRSALGNLTNNVKMMPMTTKTVNSEDALKANQHVSKRKESYLSGTQAQVLKETQNTIINDDVSTRQPLQKKIATRASTRQSIIAANAKNAKNEEETASKATTNNVTTIPNIKILTTTAPSVKTRKSGQALKLAPLPGAPITVLSQVKQTQSNKPVRRISNEFNKTEESLYMSALEDISSCESVRLSGNFEAAKRRSALLIQEKNKAESSPCQGKGDKPPPAGVPEGVEDFDKFHWNDIFQVSNYAMDIFEYMKSREAEFPITDYMVKQVNLNKWMRTLLIDWMVEVQETFELNHETLYLAVKIVISFYVASLSIKMCCNYLVRQHFL